MEIKTKDITFCKKGRKIGSGKSIEYIKGSELYDTLKLGDSVFILNSEMSRVKLLVRFFRIWELDRKDLGETRRAFTTTAGRDSEGRIGFHVLRIL